MHLAGYMHHPAPGRAGRGGRGPGDPFPTTRDNDTGALSRNGSRAIGPDTVVVRGPRPPRPACPGVHELREIL